MFIFIIISIVVIITSSIIVIAPKKKRLNHLNPGVRERQPRQKVKSDDYGYVYDEELSEDTGKDTACLNRILPSVAKNDQRIANGDDQGLDASSNGEWMRR